MQCPGLYCEGFGVYCTFFRFYASWRTVLPIPFNWFISLRFTASDSLVNVPSAERIGVSRIALIDTVVDAAVATIFLLSAS